MLLQILSQSMRIRGATVHSYRESFHATQYKEAIERAWDRPNSILQKADPLAYLSALSYNDSATNHVGMTVKILCSRVDYQRESVLQRSLEIWRGKSVITHRYQTFSLRKSGNLL
jgi:hypothetical protein